MATLLAVRSQPLVLCALLAACAGGSHGMATPSSYSSSSYSGGGASPVATAPSSAPNMGYGDVTPAPEPAAERPGLGTTWGERVSSPLTFTPFTRASAAPWAEVLLHYNDADGIEAHARYLNARLSPLEVYAGDGGISVALVDDRGRILPGFVADDRTLVEGVDSARYKIVVRNSTTARFEVVASVDGLDVVDGKPADPNRRGYLIDPHGELVIDGFRTSDDEVAAFRFGKVADSYAAHTTGDRNVGVVGLAIFAERGAVWTRTELDRRDTADPFPSRGYATPPR